MFMLKTHKRIAKVLLLLCALFLMMVNVHAEEPETEPTGTAGAAIVRTESGGDYLYDSATNKKVTGFSGIKEYPEKSGNFYYFKNTSGQIYANQVFSINKVYFAADKDGKLKTGPVTVSGKNYYFDPLTFERKTGWVTYGKYDYYFGTSGAQVAGWLKTTDATYYLNPDNKGAKVVSKWKKIGEKYYYFNEEGKMQKDGWLVVKGKDYYVNSKGERVTGLVTIDGKTYYLKKTGNKKIGWSTVNGKKYFMIKSGASKGEAAVGWKTITGKKYYFGADGSMKTGWVTTNDNRKYYLDPATGAMVTGTKVIDGTTYDFGTAGYLVPSGPWSIQVNQTTNVVTIFRGSTPVKAMLCSVGLNGATPNGNFKLMDKLYWHELMGPSWGQYCEHLTSDILFHSIPYQVRNNPRSLHGYTYNKLGQAASHGCIRLNVESAKYIFDNCPIGTPVKVFRGTSKDDPLGKPALVRVPDSQNYDPTDTFVNPYNAK